MGWPGAYKPRKFEVGEQLLALRTRAKLTQVELAALVGVSHRSVQGWEAGAAYPKEDNLQRLISIFLTRGALTVGQEYNEAFRLWQQVDQDAPRRIARFDEKWFATLLATYQRGEPQVTIPEPLDSSSPTNVAAAQPFAPSRPLPRIVDWGEAPDVPDLYGREAELATLQQWVVEERCRVVALLGLGGIGKTSLALTFANQASAHFDAVFFRSLRNAPPLAFILDSLIQAASPQHSTLPESVADKITLLIQLLREGHYLIVLDNLEIILQPGAYAGEYRTNYEEYGLFIQRLGEIPHRSCLVLTSREKPSELGPMEGRSAPVRSLSLTGLANDACRVILEEKELFGMEAEVSALANLYGGNPLALKLISQPIHEVFSGNLRLFLSTGNAFFGAVGKLLDQQFQRSVSTEQALLYWMAIERDFVSLDALQANFVGGLLQRDILIALESLWRRLLIERRTHPLAFSLQPVIMEFLTDQLVERIHDEIVDGQPQLLRSHALVQATAKDHMRRSQEELIATPLLEQLMMTMGGATAVEQLLVNLLQQWRSQSQLQRHASMSGVYQEQGYGPGNVVNLLRLLRGDLRGLDLSRLALRGVYLQSVEMQDARLSGALLQDCVVSEALGIVHTVASTPSGSYWAASSINGEVRVWRSGGRTMHLSLPAHKKAVMALTFSPDEKLLASGSWDCTVKLWDLQSGAHLSTLEGHTDYVQSIAFSPDGRRLASGSDDQTLRIWDIASGECLKIIHAHMDNTYGVDWSSDGKWIVTCGFDCLMHLWDVASVARVITLIGLT